MFHAGPPPIASNPMSTKLTKSREIRARGPRPDWKGLRRAYLDLLKLSLCDLVGVGTESVVMSIDGEGFVSRESTPEELEFRAVGKHWPRRGLTMVGLHRLDDLEACVESVVEDGVEGDLIEAGVWRGGASILMRATLDSLGAEDRVVWLADSFDGFPAPSKRFFLEDRGRDLSHFDFLAVPMEHVQANFARLGLERGVRFVPGFFQETMPILRHGCWSLIRLDGDTYESTRLALDALYPGLSRDGYLIVDDYKLLPECRRAVDEFRTEHRITEPLEAVDWTCVRWRRDSEPAPDRARLEGPAEPVVAPRSGAPRHRQPIPTQRELFLVQHANRLSEELDAARAQIQADRGPGTRIRRRLRAFVDQKLGSK
jgi:O-methyltransferase